MQIFSFRQLFVFTVSVLLSVSVRAQMKLGSNPTSIHGDAILDMESTNKGMLLPRLALVSTDNATPLGSFATGMTVYNTATSGSGPTAVSPGIYYSDGTQWIKTSPTSIANMVQRIEYTASQGQINFVTPSIITDINKITLYRNGVLINCTLAGAAIVTAEVPCEANDNVKIIQQL